MGDAFFFFFFFFFFLVPIDSKDGIQTLTEQALRHQSRPL